MIEVYSNTFDVGSKQYSSFFFPRITKSTQKALFCSASPAKNVNKMASASIFVPTRASTAAQRAAPEFG